MAETLGWPVGLLKDMVSSQEFTLWGCEFELRAQEEKVYRMQSDVNARAHERSAIAAKGDGTT